MKIRGAKVVAIWRTNKTSIFLAIGMWVILLGIGIYIQQSNISKNELKQAQALQIFLRIDDYAHEWIIELRPRWTEESWAINKFEVVDHKFHEAKTLKERFNRAIKMDEILDEIDVNIHEKWNTDKIENFEYRDGKFHEINNIFDQLIN